MQYKNIIITRTYKNIKLRPPLSILSRPGLFFQFFHWRIVQAHVAVADPSFGKSHEWPYPLHSIPGSCGEFGALWPPVSRDFSKNK